MLAMLLRALAPVGRPAGSCSAWHQQLPTLTHFILQPAPPCQSLLQPASRAFSQHAPAAGLAAWRSSGSSAGSSAAGSSSSSSSRAPDSGFLKACTTTRQHLQHQHIQQQQQQRRRSYHYQPGRPLEPPTEPDPEECCGQGCADCVWTVYYEELKQYTAALAVQQGQAPPEDPFEAMERRLAEQQQAAAAAGDAAAASAAASKGASGGG